MLPELSEGMTALIATDWLLHRARKACVLD